MINDEKAPLKPLPAGIATFRKLVENGYLYVDKTEDMYQLIRNPGGVYFSAETGGSAGVGRADRYAVISFCYAYL